MKHYTCMFAAMLAVGCVTAEKQKEDSDQQTIRATSQAVLATIEKKDVKGFRELVGVPLEEIGQTEVTLIRKFERICDVYAEYIKGERPPVYITDSVSTFNKRVVFVPIYSGKGLKGEIGQVRLMLLYGPKSHYRYDKISDIALQIYNHSSNDLPLPDSELPAP